MVLTATTAVCLANRPRRWTHLSGGARLELGLGAGGTQWNATPTAHPDLPALATKASRFDRFRRWRRGHRQPSEAQPLHLRGGSTSSEPTAPPGAKPKGRCRRPHPPVQASTIGGPRQESKHALRTVALLGTQVERESCRPGRLLELRLMWAWAGPTAGRDRARTWKRDPPLFQLAPADPGQTDLGKPRSSPRQPPIANAGRRPGIIVTLPPPRQARFQLQRQSQRRGAPLQRAGVGAACSTSPRCAFGAWRGWAGHQRRPRRAR